MIQLPYLDSWDVTPVEITLLGGIGEDGDNEVLGTWSGKVNYSEKSKRVQNKTGQWILLSATIRVKGDILPGVEFVSGTVKVSGYDTVKSIVSYTRPRNPDGTVNHTKLELV